MDSPIRRSGTRREFHLAALGLLASASAGCGTLMHPERRGQGRNGSIDWTVVGLDAIGLCFFFIPGVIAFAVDYYNGTMFYPESSAPPATASGSASVSTASSTAAPGKLRSVPIPENASLSDLAAILSRETGQEIVLDDGNYLRRAMNSLDEFWSLERDCSESAEG